MTDFFPFYDVGYVYIYAYIIIIFIDTAWLNLSLDVSFRKEQLY